MASVRVARLQFPCMGASRSQFLCIEHFPQSGAYIFFSKALRLLVQVGHFMLVLEIANPSIEFFIRRLQYRPPHLQLRLELVHRSLDSGLGEEKAEYR